MASASGTVFVWSKTSVYPPALSHGKGGGSGGYTPAALPEIAQPVSYTHLVYDAGYSPICPMLYLPLFLNDAVPEEHKNGIDMGRDLLRRSRGEERQRAASHSRSFLYAARGSLYA